MSDYYSLFLFCLVMAVTPGPNNVILFTTSVNHGIRQTLPYYFGVTIGFPIMVFFVGMGTGSLFLQYPVILVVFKYVGCAFMLLIAWKIATASIDVDNPATLSRPFTFWQSVLLQWSNAKGWLMAISAFSLYGQRIADGILLESLIISGTFFSLSFFSSGIWMLGGASIKRFLKNKRGLLWFNRGMAALLVLTMLELLYSP